MAGNHKRRKRSIDVEKLTPEQADKITAQLGQEIAKIMDDANEKCNKLLGIYGMETVISYAVAKKGELDKQKLKEMRDGKL